MKTLTRLGLAAAVATLAVAAPLAAAPAASAHDAIADLDCAGWSASAVAYDAEATGLVIADGVTVHDGTFGGAGTLSGTWAAEADEHRLQVVIDSTEDRYDYSFDETVDGCGPEIPPMPEPDTASSSVVTDGEIECGATTVTTTTVVTATSTPYVLVDGAWVPDYAATVVTGTSTTTGERELAPDEQIPCPTPPVEPTPPTEEPTPSTPPVEPTPTEEPAPVEPVATPEAPAPTPIAAAPVVQADAPATLPVTGTSAVPTVLVAIAVFVLALGGLALALARRARR